MARGKIGDAEGQMAEHGRRLRIARWSRAGGASPPRLRGRVGRGFARDGLGDHLRDARTIGHDVQIAESQDAESDHLQKRIATFDLARYHQVRNAGRRRSRRRGLPSDRRNPRCRGRSEPACGTTRRSPVALRILQMMRSALVEFCADRVRERAAVSRHANRVCVTSVRDGHVRTPSPPLPRKRGRERTARVGRTVALLRQASRARRRRTRSRARAPLPRRGRPDRRNSPNSRRIRSSARASARSRRRRAPRVISASTHRSVRHICASVMPRNACGRGSARDVRVGGELVPAEQRDDHVAGVEERDLVAGRLHAPLEAEILIEADAAGEIASRRASRHSGVVLSFVALKTMRVAADACASARSARW